MCCVLPKKGPSWRVAAIMCRAVNSSGQATQPLHACLHACLSVSSVCPQCVRSVWSHTRGWFTRVAFRCCRARRSGCVSGSRSSNAATATDGDARLSPNRCVCRKSSTRAGISPPATQRNMVTTTRSLTKNGSAKRKTKAKPRQTRTGTWYLILEMRLYDW